MKRIGIMTTGGDCSGLNSVIYRIVQAGHLNKWTIIGIQDGTDSLISNKTKTVELTPDNFSIELSNLAGSYLHNGNPHVLNFEKAAKNNQIKQFNTKLHNALKNLKLDALILIGGNGSLSLAWTYKEIYSDLSLICIPKTIDMDIPLTDKTIGFNTAVQQLTHFCDDIILTARSHHRWFIVQTMGRDCGQLALHAGIACNASAILIPEIKFSVNDLIEHIKNTKQDYGIIMVSEGVSLRGHSGKPADMISRQFTAANIPNRAIFPEHIQRTGSTSADDKILASMMVECAINAIKNKETYVMTAYQNGICKTIPLHDFFESGHKQNDPNISGITTSDAFVTPDNPLLQTAQSLGIYIGNKK